MSYRTLADFLEELTRDGEIVRVSAPVDPVLEIAEVTRRVARAPGPALLFERPTGHSMAVVTNLLGTEARVCRALEISSLLEISGRLESLVAQSTAHAWLDRLKAAAQQPALDRFRPRTVKTAAAQQVVRLGRDVDLAELPLTTCWPLDTNAQITAQLVVQDRNLCERHVGLYRLQLVDRNTLAILDDGQSTLKRYWDDFRADGDKMPLAIALGGDPTCTIAAATSPAVAGPPAALDGYLFAGMLRGHPLEVIKCRTGPLEIPAETDVVIEGYLDPSAGGATVTTGDLANGYYRTLAAPVMRVSAITQRANAVLPTVISGGGGEIAILRKLNERMLLPVVAAAIPELVDYALPTWGGLHAFALVAIRKTFPYQGRKVASALWGLGALMHTKFVIVVDEQVDVHDPFAVLGRLGANVDPARDLFLVDGPAHVSDHATRVPMLGRHVGIDATIKLPAEHGRDWPAALTMSREVEELVSGRWAEYGIGARASGN